MRDPSHRGNGDQTSTLSATVGDPTITAEGSTQESPPASSPSKDDPSGGDGVSGADADDS